MNVRIPLLAMPVIVAAALVALCFAVPALATEGANQPEPSNASQASGLRQNDLETLQGDNATDSQTADDVVMDAGTGIYSGYLASELRRLKITKAVLTPFWAVGRFIARACGAPDFKYGNEDRIDQLIAACEYHLRGGRNEGLSTRSLLDDANTSGVEE